MGIPETLRRISAIIKNPRGGDDLLEPLLRAAGIEAALLDYDSDSRQVILAILIGAQTKHIQLPIRQRFSRAEICQLIAGTPAEAKSLAGQPDKEKISVSGRTPHHAKPPPRSSEKSGRRKMG
jgi:hypothetical protein